MFRSYRKIASTHKKLSIADERKLIRKAKKGDVSARKKLLLHLLGFFIFRIETTLETRIRRELGEDILQECILFASGKIPKFKLRYKTKAGIYKQYQLSTYLWKGITGVIYQQVNNRPRTCELKLPAESCGESSIG